MNKKTIELELRAEVSAQDQEVLKKRLEKMGTVHSHTRRLSVMCFGAIGRKQLDVRVRMTNGECEVVVKSGSFGSHDRTEIAQKITPEQFLGFVKIFTQCNFTMKIGERETLNYALPDAMMVSLVSAGPIVYVELEKMSSTSNIDQHHNRLKKRAGQLKLKLLNEEEFNMLCDRLTKIVDWPFHGTDEEYVHLTHLIHRYMKY